MSALRDAELPFEHEVYRIYDKADRLLYVGMARQAENRIHAHVSFMNSGTQASWLMVHAMSTWCRETYPTRAAARDAERQAIKAEHPFFNNHSNKGWHLMRDEYLIVYGEGDTYEESERILRRPMWEDGVLNRWPDECERPPSPFVRDRQAEVATIAAYVKRFNLTPTVEAAS